MKLKEQAKLKELLQKEKDRYELTRKKEADLFKSMASDKYSSAVAFAQTFIHEDEDWFEDAVRYLDIALKYSPGNPWWILERKGHVLRKLKRYDEAINTLKNSLNKNPKNAWAHTELGECLRLQGHNQWALDTFEAALSLEPNHAWASERKGRVLLSLRRYDEAINILTRVVNDIQKDNAYAWSELGESYRKKGLNNEALNAQEKAISINQNLLRAWERKGLVLRLMDRCNESIDALNEAKRIIKHRNMDDTKRITWINKEVYRCLSRVGTH